MAKVQYRHAHYLGGHPDAEKPVDGMLTVDKNGFSFRVIRQAFEVPWGDVADLAFEGADVAEKRVTVARALTLGIFALAAKKKSKTAYLSITTQAGDEIVLRIDDVLPLEVKAALARFRRST